MKDAEHLERLKTKLNEAVEACMKQNFTALAQRFVGWQSQLQLGCADHDFAGWLIRQADYWQPKDRKYADYLRAVASKRNGD
jgi:hypothetical protein